MSPSPLSGLLAVDRSNAAKNFRKQRQSRSHARRIYCAAYETSQGDRFDSFSAFADLLIIGGEDFFDLSGVLQSGHGDCPNSAESQQRTLGRSPGFQQGQREAVRWIGSESLTFCYLEDGTFAAEVF